MQRLCGGREHGVFSEANEVGTEISGRSIQWKVLDRWLRPRAQDLREEMNIS